VTAPDDSAAGADARNVWNVVILFWTDLAQAWRACWSAPTLPILSVLLILPAEAWSLFPAESERGAREVTELLSLPLGLFSVGWLGTQRIWYQRIFEGHMLSPAEVWRLSWGFFGRFLVLGLLVGIPGFLVIFWLVAQIATGAVSAPSHPFKSPIWWNPFWLGYGFLVDVLLTFVTSALAYTTNRVREAWRIGLKMIADTWPASWAYVLVPPITLLALATLNPIGFPALAMLVLAVISTVVGLLVKGAIAAYYLRHGPRRTDVPSALHGPGPGPGPDPITG
jgi:hypothetical protein